MSRTLHHALIVMSRAAASAPLTVAALMLIHAPRAEALEPGAETPPVASETPSSVNSVPPTNAGPPQAPVPAIAAPSPPPVPPPIPGGLVFRAVAGAGFSNYEDRESTSRDAHMFADGVAALAAGYAPFRRPEGSLDLAAEVVLSHSLQGSAGSRAAGNFMAAGLVLSTFLERVQAEIGLGGYLVRRAAEARDLGLTSSRWNGGVGAFLAKYWPLANGWAWGVSFKVLMLPTRTEVEADGQKHVHFSDGIGILGLSAAWR